MTVLERLQYRTKEPDELLLTDVIESARAVILSRRFPFGYTAEQEVEPQYQDLWYRIALDLYDKDGAEGQLSHSENAISRSWESGWVSASLLAEITPMCGSMKRGGV